MSRVRTYIGLGSNIGRPAATLARAVEALRALPGARLRGVSRLYRTRPVGVVDQPDFLNAVVALDLPSGPDPERAALDLLAHLKAIETELGRRPGQRWGPRALDLDLLLFGRSRLAVERPPGMPAEGGFGEEASAVEREPHQPRLLVVPHRDVGERLFVLAPLSDLAPRLVPPGWHETVTTARRRREAIEGASAARAVGGWDIQHGGWTR